MLEKALRTHPASVPQRWDKIAEEIPNRTKKDCMKRYKVWYYKIMKDCAKRYKT